MANKLKAGNLAFVTGPVETMQVVLTIPAVLGLDPNALETSQT